MADELISRQAAHDMMVHLQRYVWDSPISNERHVTVDADEVNFGLDKLPAVDAVEVVRCVECINRNKGGVCQKFRQRYPFYPEDNFYCGYGERREENA